MRTAMAHLLDVTNASTVEALWKLHTSYMESYGFDRLIYGNSDYSSATSLGDPQDWLLLTNHGDRYMEAFLTDGLLFQCRASTTLSGSDNHFGRFMSRCGVAYLVVSLSVFSSGLFRADVVAGAFW